MAHQPATKPRKQPRQARSQATVEAILTGAAQVFTRYGYAGATTDRIAERAGVSIGSLYQYFPNKDSLLTLLAQRHVDDGFVRLEMLLDQSLENPPALKELLAGFVDAMIALHEEQPKLHRVLFEEAPLPASLRRKLRERQAAFTGRVAELLTVLPEFGRRHPHLSAYVVVQTVEGLVHENVLNRSRGIDPAELSRETVEMLSAYLKSSAP